MSKEGLTTEIKIDFRKELEKKNDVIKLLQDELAKQSAKNRQLEEIMKKNEDKFAKLEKKVKDNIQSSKNALNHIKSIKIELYYVYTKIENEKCGFCEEFIKQGYYEQFRKFPSIFQFNGNYSLIEYKCDWSDIKYYDGDYSVELTDEGLNFLYATGCDVEYFPTLDVEVIDVKGREYFKRFNGIGYPLPDGNVKITILSTLVQWLLDLDSIDLTTDVNIRGGIESRDAMIEKKIQNRR